MGNDSILREEQIWNSVYDAAEKALKITPQKLIPVVNFDLITATYPDAVTEVFTYSLASNTVLVVTVVYTAANKKDILTVGFA